MLQCYNSYSPNAMSMTQFEEYVANTLFYPEKLCKSLSNDFMQFDSPNNIWKHQKSMPCYPFLNEIRYELTNDAISLFKFSPSNSKNRISVTRISVDSNIQIRLLNQRFEVIYTTIDKNCTLIIDENDEIGPYYIEFISPVTENQIYIQYRTYDRFNDGSYGIDKNNLTANMTQILYKPNVSATYSISAIITQSNIEDMLSDNVDITVYEASSGCRIKSMMNYENRNTAYVCYFEANEYYIIDIKVENEDASITIHINNNYDQKVSNITGYTIFEQDGVNLQGITQLDFKGYGNYTISLDYIPQPFTISFKSFQVKLIKRSNEGIVEMYSGNISTYSKSIITTGDIKDGDVIDVLYDNPCIDGKVLIEVGRYNQIDNIFSLTPDKNGADVSLMGTEVTLNNGQRESKMCTVGFTRCLFPGINAPSLQRGDYYWFSDNDNIASVSAYGTVQTKRSGTVGIYCVYKYDYKYYGEINITVNSDLNTSVVNLSYGLDCRMNGITSGTEVTSGKGNIIPISQYNADVILSVHQNCTRLICIGSDSPNSYLQDFLWQSSDESKIYVSLYGTITGISPTDEDNYVTITGVYKYNPRYKIQLKMYCYE